MITRGSLLARDHTREETKNKTKQQEPGTLIFANMRKGSMKKKEVSEERRPTREGK